MKLFECEAKEIAAKFQLSVPRGIIATSVDEALKAFDSFRAPVFLKVQILGVSRKKAGGVLLASSKEEVQSFAEKLLASTVHGEKVQKILVEEKISGVKELYAGISIDREHRCYLLLASGHGGSDIEQLVGEDPARILRKKIDPLAGISREDVREIAQKLGYSSERLERLEATILRLHELAATSDAELIEVNPLMETPEGEFILVDLKMIIDDNSLFRHPEFSQLGGVEDLSPREKEARRQGLAYIELDGDIGVLGNGAGLVMATLDLVAQFGGRPANFCDVGGGADTERVESALEIILKNENVKVVLVNILGGITRCDEVAKGILKSRDRIGLDRPLVVRIVGTFENEGKKILREASIPYHDSMEESAQEAVRLSMRA